MRRITVDISDKRIFNKVFIPYLKDLTRTQIFFGGSAAGKSVFLSQRCVIDILQGERNYLIIRNTANTLRDSIFNEINKVIIAWNLEELFKINQSDLTITCKNGYQILFKGLDKVEKLKSITSKKGVVTDILIEEATETTEDDIKQLYRRLRGRSNVPKRVTLSFNPIMRTHWIFKRFFQNWPEGFFEYHDEKLSILKTTYKDNKFLEQDDIDELENETDEYYYDVYTLGNWGILGDLIFTNWKVEDLSGIEKQFASYYNGLDFGYCVDEETEILTKKGWKRHDTLTIKDIALTINPETGLSEWQKIQKVNHFEGRYNMRLIEGQSHSSFTTSNHRWLIEPRPTSRVYKRRFQTTIELGGADAIACARKCENLPQTKKYTDNFVELIAWFWTEGQITEGGISIWQNEGGNADRIRGCLRKEFGEELTKTRNGRNRAKAGWKERPKREKGLCHWAMNLNGALRFLEIAPKKIIKPDFIVSLTIEQLHLFIDISIRADGSKTNCGTRVITQSTKERLESLQMACSLAGIRTTLLHRNNGGRGKDVYYGNPYWRLILFKNNDRLYIGELIKRRSSVKEIIYEGLVWCPTTSNGTWLARRNGTVYFTGNSNDPAAFGRQAIKGKDLYILQELYERGWTNDILALKIKPIIGKEYVRCDASEPKSIAELRGYGINAIAAKKGPGSIHFGIQYLKQFDIHIDRRCQNAANEFQLYQWKKNAAGETMKEPVDKHNHFIDQLRYAVSDRIFERKIKTKVYKTKEELGVF